MNRSNERSEIRLLIVDDHRLLRDCLRSLLTSQIQSLNVVGECGDGKAALKMAAVETPEIIIMDIDMPGMGAFDAAREILSKSPNTKIIFLSAYARDAQIEEALTLGARGYIVKTDGLSVVADGIQLVANGGTFLSERVQARVNNLATEGAATTRRQSLTPRENQILIMLAKGESVKRIAYELGVTYKTVDKHKVSLMRKLDIHDRVELCRFAVREEIIEA